MTVPDRAARDALHAAVREAGRVILAVRASGEAVREDKADGTPVSDADRGADEVIASALAAVDPGAPVVSEERPHPDAAGGRARHWLVDPLDGTRGFLAGGDEFTVNVALVEDGAPRFGCVLHPPTGRLYAGGAGVPAAVEEDGAAPRPLRVRRCPAAGPHVLTSSHHPDGATAELLGRLRFGGRKRLSSSLKFCRVAEGSADLYVRFGPTMEWDTAAGHAVLAAAGGAVRCPDGAPFRYGRRDRMNGAFVAEGDPAWRKFLREAPALHA